jgi:hypothetical protein
MPDEKVMISKRSLLALKPLTLVAATGLSLFGSLGQFFVVDRWEDIVAAKASEIQSIETRIATLRETQSSYFANYLQANLLFALDPADSSRDRGVTAQMYRLAILDRAFPFRNMMAEMANAGVFEFKTTNDSYRALSEAARQDLSWENYGKLNTFEKDILDKALALQHDLQLRYLDAKTEKVAAEQARDTRRFWLTILTAFGTVMLLAANLLAERRR